jgi:hypothetical protein
MELGHGGQFTTKVEGFTKAFFDRDAVMKAADKGIRKQLSWFGGYCRRVWRNSLKENSGISQPGSPPFVHTTYIRRHTGRQRKVLATPQVRLQYKDSILYAMNYRDMEVMIGPVLFNGKSGAPVPGLLEGGGAAIVTTKKTTRTLHYRARPGGQLAFAKSLDKLGERLKGCVTKG